jgi:pimeloyl-ACP methyl ester carboxylesterase
MNAMNSPVSRPALPAGDAVDDWHALGDLIDVVTERLTAPVEGIHRAIGDRWFGFEKTEGPSGRATHRALTQRIYGSVRLVGSVVGATLGTGATAISRHRTVRPLWKSPAGAEFQAAVNALWGDEFERRASPMHTGLGIRDSGGTPIASNASSLTQAFPAPTRRLAVLLHGLGKTERCWSNKENDSGSIPGFSSTLDADGFTPVSVRYNTGRRVSDNGTALARLLEETTTNWPVPIDEIVLIGHSMGGLVARSSLHAGESAGHKWTHHVQHVVALGTPHFGSPIEKGAHIASLILEKAAVSRPLGQFVDGRSAGIKDMRHGNIHDTEHSDRGKDQSGRYVVGSPIEGVHQHHAASVVTDKASNPFGLLVGDLVVRVDSALGRSSNSHVEADSVRIFGGLNHLGMLHDPEVHAQISDWLTAVAAEPRSVKS